MQRLGDAAHCNDIYVICVKLQENVLSWLWRGGALIFVQVLPVRLWALFTNVGSTQDKHREQFGKVIDSFSQFSALLQPE